MPHKRIPADPPKTPSPLKQEDINSDSKASTTTESAVKGAKTMPKRNKMFDLAGKVTSLENASEKGISKKKKNMKDVGTSVPKRALPVDDDDAVPSKKKKDPNAPKAVRSAYNLFVQAKKKEFQDANPGAKFTEISKLLSIAWKEMKADERQPFHFQSLSDKERYEREMEEYTKKFPQPRFLENTRVSTKPEVEESDEDEYEELPQILSQTSAALRKAVSAENLLDSEKDNTRTKDDPVIAEIEENPVATPIVSSKKSKKRAVILSTTPLGGNTEQRVSPPDSGAVETGTTKIVTSSTSVSVADIADEKKVVDKEEKIGIGPKSKAPSDVNSVEIKNVQLQEKFGKYKARAIDLIGQAKSSIVTFSRKSKLISNEKCIDGNIEEFPDSLRAQLALFVEGSTLPLTELAIECHKQLLSFAPSLKLETVAEKIKVISQRKAYFGPVDKNLILGLESNALSGTVNPHEDTTFTAIWFWELVTLDYISSEYQSLAKKNRSDLRKLANFFKACRQLLITVDGHRETKDIDDKLSAKLVEQEEKILKYEREEEKQRIFQAKKKEDLEAKARSLEERKAQREAAKAAKKAEMEEKRQQVKEEKEKERLAKEEEIRKRKEAELEAEAKAAKRNKQFFADFLKKKPSPSKKVPVKSSIIVNDDFDSDKFWSSLNKGAEAISIKNMFQNLSLSALNSRKKTVKTFSIIVEVVPDEPTNCFETSGAYSEETTAFIRDKMKHLQFCENYRPAYHGTWSKKSCIISGRRPFGKDTTHLDYEYDSEAEWEEEPEGEAIDDDCDDGDSLDELGLDTKELDYQDGWLMEDDDLGLSDDDEETKKLRRKALNEASEVAAIPKLLIIEPTYGGIALASNDMGVEEKEELSNYVTHIISPEVNICLDPFEPTLANEASAKSLDKTVSPQKQGLSREGMQLFCKFIHNSTLSSKDKVIDEFRTIYPEIFDKSRAAALRKLDAVAEKKRSQLGGYIWEVKREILIKNGLVDLIDTTPPPVIVPTTVNTPAPSKKKAAATKVTPTVTPLSTQKKHSIDFSIENGPSGKRTKVESAKTDLNHAEKSTNNAPKMTLHNFFNKAAKPTN